MIDFALPVYFFELSHTLSKILALSLLGAGVFYFSHQILGLAAESCMFHDAHASHLVFFANN
jgi:hypothetical protein